MIEEIRNFSCMGRRRMHGACRAAFQSVVHRPSRSRGRAGRKRGKELGTATLRRRVHMPVRAAAARGNGVSAASSRTLCHKPFNLCATAERSGGFGPVATDHRAAEGKG